MKTTDVELIQRTLDGDERAFTELVNKYQKSVHALIWQKIGDFHIAEELTQDVFLKAYNKLSTLKPPFHFSGWLYVIATRHCISWHRKQKPPTTSLDALPTAELEAACYSHYEAGHNEKAAVERQRELVKRLLQQLPESERTVVTLHYLSEMSCEEIGTLLGVSANTVKSRLYRARKRLEKQEHLLHNISGVFQLPPTLTENIMREVSRLQPAAPPVSRPWLPWGISFSATCLVILMMGFGPRALSRFQQPYNLDATSEMTVELVDTPLVLALDKKRDLRNQYGTAAIAGKGKGAHPTNDAGFWAVTQADTVEMSETKPQWMPAKGPGGGRVNNLFVTSQKEVYAIGGTRLYRLTDDNSTKWTLINAALPWTPYIQPMAERDGTLYIVTEKHLFASTDRGVTLQLVGPRPQGHAVALLITEPSRVHRPQDIQFEMYLVFRDGVFRSTDAGNTWHAFNDGLTAPEILAAAVIDNAFFLGTNPLFLGTKQGLYRLNAGVWEKLHIPLSQSIDSLAVTDNRIYICTGKRKDQESASLFVSNDFGESWMNITPASQGLRMSPLRIGFAKLLAEGDTVLVLGAGALRSTDAGNTWESLGFNRLTLTVHLAPGVAVDEDTFFIAGMDLARSIDSGKSWHSFAAGIAEPHILDLAQVNNVLYATTNKDIVTSTDGGTQWASVGMTLSLPSHKSLGALQLSHLTAVGDALYVRAKNGGSINGLFHLPPHANTLLPLEGMPVYVDASHIEEGVTRTTGEFAISDNTFYIEYERKLYRATLGELEWHDTGMQDAPVFADFYATDGFQFAVSGKAIYLGKSDGSLFQSLDSGDTWWDITADFPFPLNRAESQDRLLKKLPHFKEIVFVGNTVYVSTHDGVAMSSDGENWHPLTDEKYAPVAMHQLAVKGTTLYGVSKTGTYRLNNSTGTWIQIASEVPGRVTSFVVAGNVLYVGTEHRGILRVPLQDL